MRPAARVLAVAACVLLPSVAFAAAPRTFAELADMLISLINAATAVLVTAGVAIYLWGVSTSIFKTGEEMSARSKTYFFWGIIILFVMVSIWGILKLLRDTLFTENPYAGTTMTPIDIGSGNDFSLPRFNE